MSGACCQLWATSSVGFVAGRLSVVITFIRLPRHKARRDEKHDGVGHGGHGTSFGIVVGKTGCDQWMRADEEAARILTKFSAPGDT
jgi:hypothetical protein